MDYCGPAGVPLSHFLGGPNRWDDLSREAALAWLGDQAKRCSECREYDDEWRDEKGLKLEGRRAPKIVTEYVCPGCEAIELHANRDHEGERRAGAKTVLTPRRLVAAASPRKRKGRRDSTP